VRQKIRDTIAGTMFSMFSWIVISACFSYYMNNIARYSFLYGSIGAFIILLLWFYLSNTILLTGCAINSIKYNSTHHSDPDGTEKIKFTRILKNK